MGYPIKQSTTAQPLVFLMVDSADHITGKTGLTPTVTLSKNGGAFGAAAGAVSEISAGWYKVAGNATDTNTLGPLLLHATSAGADPTDLMLHVVAYDPQDAVRLGLTALPNAAADAAGGLPISDAGGLDLDAKLANTNEVTAARMGALTDWIDAGRLDLLLDAVKAKTDNLPASPAATGDIPTANQNADAYLDRASAVDGYTPRQKMRLELAALAGKSSGGGASGASTPVFRAADDSKDRITATVDASGNRTAVTLDAT